MTEDERLIMKLARTLLVQEPDKPRTRESIADAVHEMARVRPGVDETTIIRELESHLSVTQVGSVQILSDRAHTPWLAAKRPGIHWKAWGRYEARLHDKLLSEVAIRDIDRTTDIVLDLLEDPNRDGIWDRRGLVVGDVQSGKTAHYAGLINKGIDAGYKVFIVLAGIHNSLRSQTQLRLDQDVIGYDSQKARVGDEMPPGIGVGLISRTPIVHSLTDSTESGDFGRLRANINFTPGGDPVVLVVKKNATVLQHVIRWARAYGSPVGSQGRKVVNQVPLLLIDDEADNASMDTNAARRDDEGNCLEYSEPSRINALIRQLLSCFEKRAYVGYTATPFANLFIYPTEESSLEDKLGRDLFPESFIINLRTSTDYIGPIQVFGLSDDVTAGISKRRGLPIVRVISDDATAIPPTHKRDLAITELPPSLKEAIKAFILCCAVRRARGQTKIHNSMLIHVTRFVAVQAQVMNLIQNEVGSLRRRFRYGDGNLPVRIEEEFRSLWDEDFAPTTEAVMEQIDDPSIHGLTWDDVCPHLSTVTESIDFKLVNGSASDVLDYFSNSGGMTVIAVGGNKLSRGLTLEGLSVSYFLRASKMYDTLLQMGRWFGYRLGYLDVCRLYLSNELLDWYRYITLAYEELRQEFDDMATHGGTPLEYQLKVRSHPAGLQITAANKLRNTRRLQVAFGNDVVETFAFHTDPAIVESNHVVLEDWLLEIGKHSEIRNNNFIWRGVSGHRITELLDGMEFHPHVRKASSGLLTPFIHTQMANGKLTSWTVALISNQTGASHTIAGLDMNLTLRTNISGTGEKFAVSRNHIISPSDEAVDLTQELYERALMITNDYRTEQGLPPDAKTPSGRAIRKVRAEENGLLLIYLLNQTQSNSEAPSPKPMVGLALSFPFIERAVPVEYESNSFYQTTFDDEGEQ